MTFSEPLLNVFDRLRRPRILVVGDLMLDRYTWGSAERVSQEAPVIVLRADRREERLGGAANVCHMLRGLEAEVVAAGVVGEDEAGRNLKALLEATGTRHSAVLTNASRPTSQKERFIGRAANRHGHQILRVDSEERRPIPALLEDRLLSAIAACGLPLRPPYTECAFDAILISDYDKGVCTPRIARALVEAAAGTRIAAVVDPGRGADWTKYRRASIIKSNRVEAELATGLAIGRQPAEAFEAAERLCTNLELDHAIITLDRDGIVLVSAKRAADDRAIHGADARPGAPVALSPRRYHYPTRARDVYDITGAGDMVLAMLGAALASGIAPSEAVRLANVAGGLEVEREGVAVIHRHEIQRDLAARPAHEPEPDSPAHEQPPRPHFLPGSSSDAAPPQAARLAIGADVLPNQDG